MANRQARRHPVQAQPGKSERTPRQRISLGGGGAARGPRPSRGSILRPNWIHDIISELRKVQWPTREEAWHLTLVVILVSVVVGAALGGLDSGFGWFMEHTLLK